MLHHITISWTPSLDVVDGYNVYRSETQGGESTSTTPINPAPVVGSTFVDDTVAVGKVYFYEVRSVAGAVQSVVSNEVVSTVILPLPPTNVSITEIV